MPSNLGSVKTCLTRAARANSHFQHHLASLCLLVSFLVVTEHESTATYIDGHVFLVRILDRRVITLDPLIMYELRY